MKIGIIGAGNVGTGIGRHLATRGHDIVVSFARSDEKVRAAAETIGGGARAVSPDDAVLHGDVVILATPWAVTLDTVRGLAEALVGKVVWDTTNPLRPDLSGLLVGTSTSGGEGVAAAAPGATIVKAVPPMAELLHSASNRIDGRLPGVFVCSDDDAARRTILGLVEDLGADGVDAGPLSNARYTEPLGMLLVQLAYVRGMGPRIGSVLIRERAPAQAPSGTGNDVDEPEPARSASTSS